MSEPDSTDLAEDLSEEALGGLCFRDPVFRERYDGFDIVGQGAYGCVALSRFLGNPVALKIFTHLSEEGRARFRTEFASAIRVTSPHAVRTYSAFDRGALCWIEMEAVEGSTLKEELQKRQKEERPFSLSEGLEIGLAVAAVLAEAHAAGIIHRDLKPANILLPRSGRPIAKLGDFGIARIVGSSKLTATGAFPGTPHFGAPEAFAGRTVGPQADIYSFSLCLYAIFTNNGFPWVLADDPTLESLVTMHVRRPPRAMRALRPGLPRVLDTLVLEGLEKRPERRPTAESLAERLARIPLSSEIAAPLPRTLGIRRLSGLVGAVLLGGFFGARMVPLWRTTASPTSLVPSPRAPSEGLAASLGSGFVHIANGPEELQELQITLVTEGGSESAFALPQGLGGYETADVALGGFRPASKKPPKEIRVRGKRSDGALVELRFASIPPLRP
jgi:serine/threonine protein kinase